MTEASGPCLGASSFLRVVGAVTKSKEFEFPTAEAMGHLMLARTLGGWSEALITLRRGLDLRSFRQAIYGSAGYRRLYRWMVKRCNRTR